MRGHHFHLTTVSLAVFLESRRAALSKDAHPGQNLDDLTVLKSLADGQKSKETTVTPPKEDEQYVPDESDSTKNRRLAEDYDSTKNGMDSSKYQGKSHCTGWSTPAEGPTCVVSSSLTAAEQQAGILEESAVR